MKLFLSTALIMLFALSAMGNPLVFKTAKDIDSPDKYVEIFTLDTSKYRDLRINITSRTIDFLVIVKAVEGDEELQLFKYHETGLHSEWPFADNWVIPSPPAKIRVYVRGKGSFKAFVWAS